MSVATTTAESLTVPDMPVPEPPFTARASSATRAMDGLPAGSSFERLIEATDRPFTFKKRSTVKSRHPLAEPADVASLPCWTQDRAWPRVAGSNSTALTRTAATPLTRISNVLG
jgi:hypothetical protein